MSPKPFGPGALDGFNNPPPSPRPVWPAANGKWRPTPPAFAPAAGYLTFSIMTPWVMASASHFRPGPPPAIGSAQYVADYNETRDETIFTKAHPSHDKTKLSLFWNAGTASAYWDRVATSFASDRHFTQSETARLLATVNVSMAGAGIGCWNAKYQYVLWRPIKAIAVANGEDPNHPTATSWSPLFATPAHPDYPSGHSCISGAAAGVLTHYFGDATPFELESNTVPGEIRKYDNFSDALAEVRDARVFAGIHFRTATVVGNALGMEVADYVVENAMQPLNGRRVGQVGK